MTHVTRELFGFLGELRRHNNREWFNANKDRYLAEVRDPLLAFIGAIAPQLTRISPHIVADARSSGGSLLRIYRDTRFSRDKTPYKTNAGLSFGLDAPRDFDAPGYYLHLAPGRVHSEQIDTRLHPTPESQAEFARNIPLGYFGDPSDVAFLVAFLSSPRARYITGERIHVDGGLHRSV